MTSFRFSPRPNRASEIAWRPWGEGAFGEARDVSKPVLLAISAVWCHWCHVMDETSYSDGEVIRLVNERFIPVRVDNDERPDVNRRYNMGGWPTTAFLTPDGDIIHGGTYLPPEAMRTYLAQVADLWRDRPGELTERLKEVAAKEDAARSTELGELTPDIVDTVGSLIRGQYDPQYGGFGREPKFPQPKILRFLLDEYRRHAYPDVATMLHRTLGAMAGSGMYDQIEGGFFRYATTRQWEIPHYEKMLEDNAELLWVYAVAHRTFPQAGYDRVVRDVIRWMDARLWRDDVKAFAGSQDADENYYTFSALNRAKHGAPFVDPTIYTSWNALAASAYFAAANALDDEAVYVRAHDALHAIVTTMWREDAGLAHFDAGSGPELVDLLGDLAALLTAQLDAYETGRHPRALDRAIATARRMHERLEDKERGGFFDAPEREEPGRVARREKPIEENAMAAEGLLRLAVLAGDDAWRQSAVRALRAYATEYQRWGQFAAAYGAVVARALGEPLSIVVVGPAGDATAEALWRAARSSTNPVRVLQRLIPGRDVARLGALGFPGERMAAYVCIGTVCSEPLGDPTALERELAGAVERQARV